MAILMGYVSALARIMGRSDFSSSSLSFLSVPASMRRGQSYTISMFGVGTDLGAIAADLGGEPVTVTSSDGSTVGITIPVGINKKHTLQGMSLRVAVAGVGSVSSAPISFLPPPGYQFIDLVSPRNDSESLTRTMLDENSDPVQAATGDQIVAPAVVNGQELVLYQDNTFSLDVSGQAGDFSFTAYMIDANGVVGASALHTVNAQIGADVTPDAFDLGERTGVALNATNIESDVITVEDIDPGESVAISVAGGQYRVSTNGGASWGAWTSAETTVEVGYQVQVRGNAAGSYLATNNVVLSIGGVSGTFPITTMASPSIEASIGISVVQSAIDKTITITANPQNFVGGVGVVFERRQVAFQSGFTVMGTVNSPPYQYVFSTALLSRGSQYDFRVAGGPVGGPANIDSEIVSVVVEHRPEVFLIAPTSVQTGQFVVNIIPTGAVLGLTLSDFVVTNGVAVSLTPGSGVGYALTIQPPSESSGNVQIALPENVCTDENGNGNIASIPITVAFNTLPADVTSPVVGLVRPEGVQTGPVTLLVELSEPASGLTREDFLLTNCTFMSLQQATVGGGLVYQLVVDPPRGVTGTLSVGVRAGAVQDAAGNNSAAVAAVYVQFDTTALAVGNPPTIGSAIPDVAPWAVGNAWSYTVPQNAFAQGDGGTYALTARQLGGADLPEGMTFQGGAFSWPAPLMGRYEIEVVATDLLGMRESQVFVLDVIGLETLATVRLINRNGVAQPGRVVDWVIRDTWGGPALADGISTSDGQGRIQLSQYLNPGDYWFFGKEQGNDEVTLVARVQFSVAA